MSIPGRLAPEDDARPDGRVIGRYLILDEIAAGGMATVHLAHVEGQNDKFVAVKCMHAHYARDPDFVSMFLDEAMLCTHIRHENVVATIDVHQEAEDEELLLVLELVEGESLSKMVRAVGLKKSRVPQPIVSAIVCDMLRGLHAAHEATNKSGEPLMIVHRDVSPHNVLVGTDGVARVLDFGVAKARGRVQQTQKGQLKGKLAYMSPEQARGRQVDRRSDVFAAGIVLWELLVGARLFDGENEAALLIAILSEAPAPPSTRDPELKRFDPLVLKALAVDPDARFATALAMAAAVEEAITPATRAEVAEWVKTEAKNSLHRRDELIKRAHQRVLTLRNPGPAPVPVPAPRLDPRVEPPEPSDEAPRSIPPKADGLSLRPPPRAAPRPLPRPLTVAEKFERQQAEARAVASSASIHQVPPASESASGATANPNEASTFEGPTPGVRNGSGARSLLDEHSVLSVVQTGRSSTPSSPAIPNMMWDASTTTTSDGEAGDKTLAMPKDAAAAVWEAVAQVTSPPQPTSPEPLAPAPLNVRDKTIPIYQVPAHLAAHMASPPAAYVPAPPPPAVQPESSRDSGERADGSPSQITSVTLTTTGLPPPIPKEHVKRLTMIAAITGGVSVLVVTAILVIVTKLSGGSSAARPDSSQVATSKATTSDARSAEVSATVTIPVPVPSPLVPEAASSPAPSAPAPTASSAQPSASASASASASVPSAPSTAVSPPRPPPAPTAAPPPQPKRTSSRPYPTTTAKPKSSSKPRR